ncbi:MAG: ABC transporter permease [Aggregatilineales bacterium]
MRKLLEIAILDLRLYLSSIGNVVSLTVLPIMLALALGGIGTGGSDDSVPEPMRIDIVDIRATPDTRLASRLHDTRDNLIVCPADASDEVNCGVSENKENLPRGIAEQRLEDGFTDAMLIMPDDDGDEYAIEYHGAATMLNSDPAYQILQVAVQQMNSAAVAANLGEAYVQTLSDAFDGTAIFSDSEQQKEYKEAVRTSAAALLRDAPVQVQYELSREGIQEDTVIIPGGFGQSVPGMATMFVLFTVLGGTGLLLQERKQWTLQRLTVMPVSRTQILGGKILSRFLLGMLQFMIILAVGFVVGLDFGDSPILLIPLMICYTLCVTALAFAIAPLIKSEGQASSITTLMAMSMAALGGAWWSLSLPFIPDFMRSIGYLTPVAWAMEGFNEILFYGGGLAEIIIPCVILLVAAAVLFGVGIRLFRDD